MGFLFLSTVNLFFIHHILVCFSISLIAASRGYPNSLPLQLYILLISLETIKTKKHAQNTEMKIKISKRQAQQQQQIPNKKNETESLQNATEFVLSSPASPGHRTCSEVWLIYPVRTQLEETDFPLASSYQLQIVSLLGLGAVPTFSSQC